MPSKALKKFSRKVNEVRSKILKLRLSLMLIIRVPQNKLNNLPHLKNTSIQAI